VQVSAEQRRIVICGTKRSFCRRAQDIARKSRHCRITQGSAGLCRTMQDTAEQCRKLQDSDEQCRKKQCRTMQQSVGQCRTEHAGQYRFATQQKAGLCMSLQYIFSFCQVVALYFI